MTSILYTTVDLASIVGFPRENSFHSTPNTDKEALFIDVIYVFARNIVFFDYFLELTAGQTISLNSRHYRALGNHTRL